MAWMLLQLMTTMGWVYAGALLLLVLFALLVAPYAGVYGEHDVETTDESPEGS